jgi:hypothetical protein
VSAGRCLLACACLLLGCRCRAPSPPDERASERIPFAVELLAQSEASGPLLSWTAESPRPVESASEEQVCLLRHVAGSPEAGVWLPFPSQHMCSKIPEGMDVSRWSLRWSPFNGFIGLTFPMGRYRMTLPVRFTGEPHEHRVRLLSTEFEMIPGAHLPPAAEILEALRRLAPHECGRVGAYALALAADAGGTALTTRLPELVAVSADKQNLMDVMVMLPETHGAVVGFLESPDATVRTTAAVALAELHRGDPACGALCDRAVAMACGVALQDPSAIEYRVLDAVANNVTRWPRGFAGALVSRFEATTDPDVLKQLGIALNACDPAKTLGPELRDRAVRAAARPLPGHPEAETFLRDLASHWQPAEPVINADGYVEEGTFFSPRVGVPVFRIPGEECPRDLGPALSALEHVTRKVIDLRASAHHHEKGGG